MAKKSDKHRKLERRAKQELWKLQRMVGRMIRALKKAP